MSFRFRWNVNFADEEEEEDYLEDPFWRWQREHESRGDPKVSPSPSYGQASSYEAYHEFRQTPQATSSISASSSKPISHSEASSSLGGSKPGRVMAIYFFSVRLLKTRPTTIKTPLSS